MNLTPVPTSGTLYANGQIKARSYEVQREVPVGTWVRVARDSFALPAGTLGVVARYSNDGFNGITAYLDSDTDGMYLGRAQAGVLEVEL